MGRRELNGERRRGQRWQCCHGDGQGRGRMRGMERMGCQWYGMGIRVGGRTEGQSVWTTEIKGAGTHETEGIATQGCFQTDDEAVRRGVGGWAYLCTPAMDHFIHRLTWEFNLIALLMPFDSIANVTQARLCTMHPSPMCRAHCLPKIKPAIEKVWEILIVQASPHTPPSLCLSALCHPFTHCLMYRRWRTKWCPSLHVHS